MILCLTPSFFRALEWLWAKLAHTESDVMRAADAQPATRKASEQLRERQSRKEPALPRSARKFHA